VKTDPSRSSGSQGLETERKRSKGLMGGGGNHAPIRRVQSLAGTTPCSRIAPPGGQDDGAGVQLQAQDRSLALRAPQPPDERLLRRPGHGVQAEGGCRGGRIIGLSCSCAAWSEPCCNLGVNIEKV
jgi:hypothetical protein